MSTLLREFASMEAIEFQSNSLLFKDLTLAVGRLRATKMTRKDINEANIDGIITKHTNILVDFSIDPAKYANAYTYIPEIKKDHILTLNMQAYVSPEATIQKFKSGKKPNVGGVDRSTSKVSGLYTTIKRRMAVTAGLIGNKKYSDAGVAAIILHEIGHVFTYYEMLTHSITLNHALDSTTRALLDTEDKQIKTEIIDAATKYLDVPDLDVSTLVNSEPKTVAAVLATAVNERQVQRSGMGSPLYDMVQFEQLSDQFAARHNAGRDLVVAMDQMYKDGNSKAYFSKRKFIILEVISVSALLLLGAFYPMLWPAVFTLACLDPNKKIYDYDKVRLQRIKEQLVQELKERGDVDKKKQVADIAAVDAILDNMNNHVNFHRIVWNAIVPGAKRKFKQEEFQRQLEELASNDLFVSAAKFDNLRG